MTGDQLPQRAEHPAGHPVHAAGLTTDPSAGSTPLDAGESCRKEYR
jgi:hypothetical protein